VDLVAHPAHRASIRSLGSLGSIRSIRSMRVRAICIIQPPSGAREMPATCTRRVCGRDAAEHFIPKRRSKGH